MLNNGITVVTSSIIISGDIATIEDYQIVNGCQTSNVLIENMDSVEGIDELIIPIRIIATKDENLKNDITRATNSQTAIKKINWKHYQHFRRNWKNTIKHIGMKILSYMRDERVNIETVIFLKIKLLQLRCR